jgi:hypothetical protein
MKDTTLFSQCLDILKRDDVKYKIKNIFEPVIEIFMDEIRPYIYISICLILFIFLMILAILTILIRGKMWDKS